MTKRREILYLLALVLLIGLCGQFYYSYHYKPLKEREIKVYYSQDSEAHLKIIEQIQEADKYVYFAVYTFTRNDIKDALLGAKHRGVDVQGASDAGQTLASEVQAKIIKELREAGIPIALAEHSGLMHIKTLVTEKAYVTGSYNWTRAASEENDEVLEVGRDQQIRREYEAILKKS